MSKSRKDIAEFYRGVADRLDALRMELPNTTEIDNKFSAFLAITAQEIRQDSDLVAAKLSLEPPESLPHDPETT